MKDLKGSRETMKARSIVVIASAAVLLVGGFVGQTRSQEQSRAAAKQSLANPTFDFSAMERFWRIVEILEDDRDPSPAQWDSLLSTPGYQALTASEFDPDFFVQCFTLAYMPSRDGELQEAMKDPKKGRYLKHYLEVRSKKLELGQHQEWLQNEVVLRESVRDACQFLPEGIPSVAPPVAFVIFAYDGRGYEPIVIDLLAASTPEFGSFLAHESHHWYRNRLLAFKADELDAEDEQLVVTLNQIQAEGVADQLDKASWLVSGGSVPPSWEVYAERYKETLTRTPGMISELDSLVCAMSEAPVDTRHRYGEAIAALVPMSGHPTGFYMARVIADELGIDRLAKDVGNPFAFCRHYDEAARLSGKAPAFSAKALRFLALLERKYTAIPDS